MTIGNRISELRKQKNYSQEYLAEILGVSRQAVSKWEQDKSSPDTQNLIALAELLGVSVEFLATGKESAAVIIQAAPPRKKIFRKPKKKTVLKCIAAFAAAVVIALVLIIHLAPADWDAGGCSGGFKTDMFIMYHEELLEKYVSTADHGEEIISITADRNSSDLEFDGRNVRLHFDVEIEFADGSKLKQRMFFKGKRYWTYKYKWSDAAVIYKTY